MLPLRKLLFHGSHRGNVFFSKQPILFLRDKVCVHDTIAAVNEKDIVTEVVGIMDNALNLKDRTLALSCSAQRHIDLQEEDCTFLEALKIYERINKGAKGYE